MQNSGYKKYAQKRICSELGRDHDRTLVKDYKSHTWELLKEKASEKGIVAIMGDSGSSYHIFRLYYDYIKREIGNIAAVVQFTDNYVERQVCGHTVSNLQVMDGLYHDLPCLVFEISDYSKYEDYLNQIGFFDVFCIYSLIGNTVSECKRKLYRAKINLELRNEIFQFMGHYHKKDEKDLHYGWREFYSAIKGRKLFLFGTGGVYSVFYSKYGEKIRVDGALDNAHKKWGTTKNEIPIYSIDELKRYDAEDVVVLITIVNYESIKEQLIENGIKYIYVFPYLESLNIRYRIAFFCKLVRKKITIPEELLWFYLYRIFPIDKNKIVVIRHYGKGYGCHNKYIVEELIKRKRNYKIIWLADDEYGIYPEGVTVEENSMKRRTYELATARLWLDNDIKRLYTRKRRGQWYINTLHGTGISLKKFYLDDAVGLSEETKERVLNDGKMANIYLAASPGIAKIYETAFDYHKDVRLTGSPRVDILMRNDQSDIERVRKKLKISESFKILLYAPTYRRTELGSFVESDGFYNIDFCRLRACLKKAFGGEWIIGVRLHPRMKPPSKKMCDEMNLIDFTSYQDVQEILLITELMITDYSSIMFDMGYSKKKVILYTPDLETYLTEQKEMYLDIRDLPFPIAKTQDEMESIILNFNEEEYGKAVESFNKQMKVLEDGYASERVADIIDEIMLANC